MHQSVSPSFFPGDGAFSQLQGLQKLYISNNQLASISGDALRGLTNLAELDLSANRIAKLSKDVFKDTHHLQRWEGVTEGGGLG